MRDPTPKSRLLAISISIAFAQKKTWETTQLAGFLSRLHRDFLQPDAGFNALMHKVAKMVM